MINEETKEKNFSIFKKKLEEIGVSISTNNEIENKIKNGTLVLLMKMV